MASRCVAAFTACTDTDAHTYRGYIRTHGCPDSVPPHEQRQTIRRLGRCPPHPPDPKGERDGNDWPLAPLPHLCCKIF